VLPEWVCISLFGLFSTLSLPGLRCSTAGFGVSKRRFKRMKGAYV
jgi:hypothetical protein